MKCCLCYLRKINFAKMNCLILGNPFIMLAIVFAIFATPVLSVSIHPQKTENHEQHQKSQIIKIIIKSPVGQLNTDWTLYFTTSNKIAQIKERIQRGRKISPFTQWLLVYAGKVLEDGRTLSSYGISEGATLYLVVRQSKIIVKTMTGKTIPIKLDSVRTVRDVKIKIWFYEDIPLNHQHLIFAGKELEDKRALSDYNIRDQSIIQLVTSIETGADPTEIIYY